MTTPLEILPVIDSTSSEAMRRLQGGRAAPFALAAHEQSAGRGRRGRQWLGRKGNVYLTLAIPPGKTSPLELATWPLRLAALVCSYLQSRHQVIASLKWPNDIYVDGEKLGGVLGESVMQGAGVHAIVIGLGLNVDHTPDGPLEADATSLGVHGVAAASAETICEELVAMFDARWPDFRDMPLAELWNAYGLPQGQVWGQTGDQPEPQLVATAYNAEGGLTLQELGSAKDTQFVSADHNYRWLYDKRHRDALPMVTLDVGNSHAKLTRFDAGAVRTAIVSDDEAWLDLLAGLKTGWPVFAVTVNVPLWRKIETRLKDCGFFPTLVPKRPVRVRMDSYNLSHIGSDRLAAMEGFLAPQQASKRFDGAVIISAGTAMTVDLLTFPGTHEGGYIMPGAAMGLAAMHEHTDGLPQVKIEGALPMIGTDTPSAMRGGMRIALQGAVQQAASEMRQRLGPDARITCVATGGGAASLFPDVQDDLLIARGIRALVLR